MNTQDSFSDQNNDSIDIVKELLYYLFFWPWFVLSVLVFVFGAYFYLRYADTIYQTSATLQVKDSSADPSSFLTQSTGAMFPYERGVRGESTNFRSARMRVPKSQPREWLAPLLPYRRA